MRIIALLIMAALPSYAGWLSPSGEWFDRLPRQYGNTGNINPAWAVANGWVELSGVEAEQARCAALGGAWTNGACVYPQPPESTEWDILPDVTIPILSTNGQPIGTARVIATPDLSLVVVTNSASPQRPEAEQLAAFRAAVERRNKAKADQSAATNAFGRGQIQDRIAAIEAWIRAQEARQ